ncbi:MAG: bifunctional (p)ppGpp synthetase/guanosine-3',5'-bis(diphosphate) 3'-pyrophosphohydrolase, partial [Desulfamplus sp.]|nr:bifunctional (p)ppGpp synthetase/guanosine-3',5'-bis(diphosphate) 3'-pyrophosphohydrolase [Desulfamplus sp.]
MLISEITAVSKSGDGNRSVRKSIDREHLSKASPRAKTIKLADLMDNCKDVCKHDPQFARTFTSEALLLMEVLADGDPQLYQQASQVISQCSREIESSNSYTSDSLSHRDLKHRLSSFSEDELQRIVFSVFRAKDISAPLYAFGANEEASEVSRIMKDENIHVAGILDKGRIEGYVFSSDLGHHGQCKTETRPFRTGQVISSESSLTDVIQVLVRHDCCFVTMCGTVFGLIDRSGIQKPMVRMWLFGMITLLEMHFVERIKTTLPQNEWQMMISPARLKKAEELSIERERRKHRCSLLDCLQLGDKISILSRDREFITDLGFKSKHEMNQTMKEIESLRNNLAHAQDIVTHDWPQIVRMVKNIELGLGRS